MSWEATILSDEERDDCTPTKEELEKYLAEPDDAVAASLDVGTKRKVAIVILYAKKVAKAQAEKTWPIAHAAGKAEGRRDVIEDLRKRNPLKARSPIGRQIAHKTWQNLLKELE